MHRRPSRHTGRNDSFPTGPLGAAVLVGLGLALLAATGARAGGGDVIWEARHAAAGRQEALASVVDSQGHVVVTGTTGDVLQDFLTVRFSGDGSGVAWARTFPSGGLGSPRAVAVDPNDNPVVVGYIWTGSDYDFQTVKYDAATGDVLWQHAFKPSASGDDFATSVALDPLGNVYVGGYSPNASARDDFVVVKYGPGGPGGDGQPLWHRRYDAGFGGHDRVLALAAGTGGVVAVGTSQNAVPQFDALAVAYTATGDLRWNRRYSRSGDDAALAVALDAAGHAVVTGYGYNGSNRDLFLAKYDASTGVDRWPVQTYDGGFDEEPRAVLVDEQGDIYVAGTTFTALGAYDFYTARHLGDTGTLVWRKVHNTVNGNLDVAVSAAVDPFGDVFVAGHAFLEDAQRYDFLTLKYRKDTGALLWDRLWSSPALRDDKAVGMGLCPTGAVLVAGWSDAWTAGSSDYDFAVLKYDPGLLNAPTGLTATAVSETQVALTWDDNSPNEDHFAVERRIGEQGTFELVATVPANQTAYTDPGLTPHTKYCYQVKAYNAADGYSHASNQACAKTTIVQFREPLWAFTYNNPAGNGPDVATAVAAGPDGHPVVTGYSFATVGSLDYYTVKLERDTGAALWSARYNDLDDEIDVARAVAVDSQGRVVVTGYSSLYGGGAANTNDIYTIGYPPSGPPETWADQYNGPGGSDDRATAIAAAVDGSDNLAVVGYGRNAQGNDDIYLLKYAPDGTRLWAAQPYDRGGNDYPASVAFAPNGDVLVVGYTAAGSSYDAFVARYSGATGERLWASTPGGPGDDYARSVAVDRHGAVYVAGERQNAEGNADFWTLKYAVGSTEELLWERIYDISGGRDDRAATVAVDPIDGQIVVAGTTTASSGRGNLHAVRYDPDGAVVWEHTLDRPDTDDQLAAAVLDRSGGVCLAARTQGTGDSDVLAMKYDHQGVLIGATVFSGPSEDEPLALAVNRYGQTFVAGYTTNASGNLDYLVVTCHDDSLQVPSPVVPAPRYTEVTVTWSDNSADEAGFRVERRVGDCETGNHWTPVHTAGANQTSWIDTGLAVGQEYCYRVQAFRENGESSRWAERQTATADPPAPSGLSAVAVNTTRIDLAWTDTTQGEERFEVERCTGAGCSDFAWVGNAPANATGYQDAAAEHSTSYRYRVKAVQTGEWASGYSAEASVTTPAPSVPTMSGVTRISEVELRVNWTAAASDQTGFKVERCAGSTCSDFALVGIVGAADRQYNDPGLFPGGTYRYRVRAYKEGAWDSSPSAIGTGTATINTPSSNTPTVVSTTELRFTWTDPCVAESGFQVERCQGSTSCTDFAVVHTAGPNVTAFNDTGVAQGTIYRYRVRAVFGEPPYPAASAWSTVRNQTTPAAAAPTGFTATRVAENRIDLAWSDSNSDESGFRVERCEGEACSDFAWRADAAPGTSGTYSDQGLPLGRTYRYRVRAYKAGVTHPWEGPYSAAASADTNLAPPSLSAAARLHAGCEDVRFTASDGATLRPYWLESGCGTPNTRFAVRLPSLATGDTALFQYWGNPAAEPVSSASATFALYDSFRGTVVDTAKWIKLGDHSISQNDDLVLDFVSSAWTRALISQASFARAEGVELYLRLSIPNIAFSNDHAILGWTYNQTTSTSSSAVYYGLYFASGNLYVREGSTNRATFAYAANQTYEVRFQLKAGQGARTYIKGGAWAHWTLLYDSNLYTNSPMRVEIVQYSHRMRIHEVRVGRTPVPEPAVAWGGGEAGAFDLSGGSWAARRPLTLTHGAAALGDCQVPLVADTSHLASEQVALSWIDAYAEETGFELEWCEDAGAPCSDFALLAALGPNAASFVHQPVTPGATYRYRVRAVKAGEWETPWSGVAVATVPGVVAPSALTATRVGESSVTLGWTDNTANESGFRVERCLEGVDCPGGFAPVVTAAPNAVSLADATALPSTAYRYRVVAFREGAWEASSAELPVTTLTPAAPSVLSAEGISESVVRLQWTGNTLDETGFEVQACPGLECSDFQPLAVAPAGASGYDHQGLSQGQSFTYRVRAVRSGGSGWQTAWAGPISASTPAVQPPDGLAATLVHSTRIDLGWNDNTSSETLFRLQRRCSGTGCTGAYGDLATPGPDTTAYQDTSVCADRTYWYQVRAEKSTEPSWTTPWSAEAQVVSPPPAVPADLTAAMVFENRIDLAWTYPAADHSGFFVYRCDAALGDSPCTPTTSVSTQAAAARAFSNTGLTANRRYRYRIDAYKTGVTCPWQASSVIVEAETIPTPPANLAAAVQNTTTVRLTWTRTTASETGTRIERCAGEGCSDFTVIHSNAGTGTTWDDATAAQGTPYTYRARHYRTTAPVWETAPSAPAYAATPAAMPPTGLALAVAGDRQVDLTWQDNTSDETGFRVERCTGEACADFTLVGTVGAGITRYEDTTAQPSTTHCYRTGAYKTATQPWTVYSPPACAFTAPAAPAGLTATAVNSRVIRLEWADAAADAEGFEVEVRVWNGRYVRIATLPVEQTTHVDFTAIDPEIEYRYRVRSFRGTERSSYSTGSVTTPPWQEGDTTWAR
ncbi:MAG: DUF2341 domain-containing protein [Thermodesulfobacteriota bacterium]